MILEKLNILIIEFIFIDDNLKIIEKNIESYMKSRYFYILFPYISFLRTTRQIFLFKNEDNIFIPIFINF